MEENVVNLIEKIARARGQEYAAGMVDLANLLVPSKEDRREETAEKAPA